MQQNRRNNDYIYRDKHYFSFVSDKPDKNSLSLQTKIKELILVLQIIKTLHSINNQLEKILIFFVKIGMTLILPAIALSNSFGLILQKEKHISTSKEN